MCCGWFTALLCTFDAYTFITCFFVSGSNQRMGEDGKERSGEKSSKSRMILKSLSLEEFAILSQFGNDKKDQFIHA